MGQDKVRAEANAGLLQLGLTIKELRDYLESENLHYEDLVAAADKMVAENEKKVS